MKFLTIKTVSERLKCSTKHVYDMIHSGALVCVRIGARKGFRISEDELKNYLGKCEFKPEQ